jgi:hypothetical protein
MLPVPLPFYFQLSPYVSLFLWDIEQQLDPGMNPMKQWEIFRPAMGLCECTVIENWTT